MKLFMIRYLCLSLFLIMTSVLWGREYKIDSFTIIPEDLSARTNPRIDNNGKKCALVKIYANDDIVEVRGGVVGNVQSTGMETRVYLTDSSKQMELVFANHYPLKVIFDDYYIPSLTGSMTYVLKLKSDESNTAVPQTSSSYAQSRQTNANPSQTPEDMYSKGDGTINGYLYVDLGLPSGLKWATCNVGASSPEDYGNYYAWDEKSSNSSYIEKRQPNYAALKSAGIIDSSGNLVTSHDVARQNWGGTWRLPTKKEFRELIEKCTWTWTIHRGHNGYKVTGPNGKSIFLPAAGIRYGTSLRDIEENGSYWSSSLNEVYGLASDLYFARAGQDVDHHLTDLTYCQSVRPVSE